MTKNSKLRLLIADDHFVVRIGLIALVGTEPNMKVVAEAADGGQAVELYKRHQPDLVLMDSRMPIKTGIEATAEILRNHPEARILMLTTFDGDEDIHQALSAGAQGYVLKSATGEKLIPAIRAVAAGQQWIPTDVANRLTARSRFEELTPREVQVLHHLAKGLANKEIADALTITEHTTKDHLKNILAKLRVANRAEAVSAAIQRGLLHL